MRPLAGAAVLPAPPAKQSLQASAAVVVLRAKTEMRAALDQSICSQCCAPEGRSVSHGLFLLWPCPWGGAHGCSVGSVLQTGASDRAELLSATLIPVTAFCDNAVEMPRGSTSYCLFDSEKFSLIVHLGTWGGKRQIYLQSTTQWKGLVTLIQWQQKWLKRLMRSKKIFISHVALLGIFSCLFVQADLNPSKVKSKCSPCKHSRFAVMICLLPLPLVSLWQQLCGTQGVSGASRGTCQYCVKG